MSDPITLQITTTPAVLPPGQPRFNIASIANVDKADLTAIVTAKHEAATRSEIRTIHARLSNAQSAHKKISSTIQTTLEQTILAYPSSPLTALAAAFQAASYHTNISVEGGFSNRTAPSTPSWSRRNDQGSTTSNERSSIYITSTLSVDNGSHTFKLHTYIPIPPALLQLFTEQAEAINLVAIIDREYMDARQRLANIPSVERAARAAIAESALRAAGDDGVALLNSLSGVNPMPILPETRPEYRPNG